MNTRQCPFCSHHSTVTNDTMDVAEWNIFKPNADGPRNFKAVAIVCPNVACKKYSVSLTMYAGFINSRDDQLQHWKLIPAAAMKIIPSYVNPAIRQDYEEACLIASLSPKAAATLARRALQGMVRDFWKVPDRPNLHQEIECIKEKVDPDIWDAIMAVKSIGNIGAHMEKDVNQIIDVEPHEAELLLRLIEDLIEGWYVDRHKRQQRLAGIMEIADQKNAAKGKP